REAVLVAGTMDAVAQELRGGVTGGELFEQQAGRQLEQLRQAEIGEVEVTFGRQEQAARVQRKVLQPVVLVEIVERLGRGAQVVEQLRPRDAAVAERLAFLEACADRLLDAVGQKDQRAGPGR